MIPMRHNTAVAAVFFLLSGVANLAFAGTYEGIPAGKYHLDKSHASLTFKVSHLGFSNYTMSFDHYDVELFFDPDHPELCTVNASIDPASLDLPSPPEGFLDDLLSDTWLNQKKFPRITFVSSAVAKADETNFIVTGELELLGVKKPVELNVIYNGGYRGHPMDPHARIGFSAKASFPRSEFGMTYGIPAPGSNMGVGDKISVEIEGEFTGPPLSTDNAEH